MKEYILCVYFKLFSVRSGDSKEKRISGSKSRRREGRDRSRSRSPRDSKKAGDDTNHSEEVFDPTNLDKVCTQMFLQM